jgi:peptidyl-prolyl cis-trans isomerase C
MMVFRTLLFVCPAACLLAQNPPPKPAQAGQDISMSAVNLTSPPAVPPDRVVITVGDIKITAAQFDQIVGTLSEGYRAAARTNARRQFAENVVRIFALAEEAKRRKLDQTPAYAVQSAFANASVLSGALYEEVSRTVQPDEAGLRAFYEAHKADFEQVRARHILIRADGSPMPLKPGQKSLSDADALAKAQEIRKKIADGGDFAEIAAKESDDTGSGANGGDLGFFRHGQMVPTFEEAAFKLKPGEVSPPVRSQFGYHIIKVEAVRGYDEAKPDIERRFRPEQTQKNLDALQQKVPVTLDPEFFGPEKAK